MILVLWGFVSDELSKKSFSLRDALSRFRPQVTPPEPPTKVTPPPVPETGTTGITGDVKEPVVTPPPIPEKNKEINKNVEEHEKDIKITDETTTVTKDVKVKKASRWRLWWGKWWKRLLWILLALLLLLLLFFLLNNSRCGGSTGRDETTHILTNPVPGRDQDRSATEIGRIRCRLSEGNRFRRRPFLLIEMMYVPCREIHCSVLLWVIA